MTDGRPSSPAERFLRARCPRVATPPWIRFWRAVEIRQQSTRSARCTRSLEVDTGSRLGREQIETSYALKQLVQAGVRIFFYLEDRERTLDSPTDKVMLALTAFADELEREKARQRTYDAISRKAKAGHVTGGKTFGYDNV